MDEFRYILMTMGECWDMDVTKEFLDYKKKNAKFWKELGEHFDDLKSDGKLYYEDFVKIISKEK